ncbi:hypothetical protein OROMI_025127 [Orobanche minor]
MPQLSWDRVVVSRVKCLEMTCGSDARSICSVLAMLESSPLVEELFLSISHVPQEVEINRLESVYGDNLTCDLLHLKTIMFEGFHCSNLCGEPISTLFKRSPILEKRVVYDTYLST